MVSMGEFAYADLSGIGFDVISIDWKKNPKTARQMAGSRVTLQGNLDPAAFYADSVSQVLYRDHWSYKLINAAGNPQRDGERHAG